MKQYVAGQPAHIERFGEASELRKQSSAHNTMRYVQNIGGVALSYGISLDLTKCRLWCVGERREGTNLVASVIESGKADEQ